MNEKIKYSILNFEKAFLKLQDYLSSPILDDRDRSGIIKAFEFTFELAWKTFQKMAINDGLEAAGPKSSLKQAFQMNIIENKDETDWLLMLDDRNLMSHTYRDQLSKEVVERIQTIYLVQLKLCLTKLKKLI
jgi:nucleotidyltransferase substrate binding protein (TIGR01987 family)